MPDYLLYLFVNNANQCHPVDELSNLKQMSHLAMFMCLDCRGCLILSPEPVSSAPFCVAVMFLMPCRFSTNHCHLNIYFPQYLLNSNEKYSTSSQMPVISHPKASQDIFLLPESCTKILFILVPWLLLYFHFDLGLQTFYYLCKQTH